MSDAQRNESLVNATVAALLLDTAQVLEQQGANPFRINAYRRAADTISHLEDDLRAIVEAHGRAALMRLPFIGGGLAATIEEIVLTGRSAQLDRLRGAVDPETLFRTVPGIGPVLARALHDELHVDTLEGLEIALHDGRLEHVQGVGSRRLAAIRVGLESLLGKRAVRTANTPPGPSIESLLRVDGDYRSKACAGDLPLIAPRRFNPKHEPWLPILHTDCDGWHFTALFSNTARAHELGHTHDWVVLYFYDGDHREGQQTVVTESRGPLAGRRIVRGRESDCARYYGTRG